ncbi:MAG: cysteine desulfurase family protein [Thermaerobacter sp.]|nr:cysteine desulfurase NifS [Bacillota bacterium]
MRDTGRIYLDHAATTPVLPEVARAMHEALLEGFGNPSSVHREGRRARAAVERARRQAAALIGADPEEIIFTGGGTEADNLAIQGAAREAGAGAHIVTTAVEHHAVLDACEALESEGYRVTVVPVDGDGRVDPDDVLAALTPDTVLVSVMLANNEVGTIQPVAEIARRARERGVLVHTDAVQAVGQIPVDVNELGIDLLSFSSHKIYGPKGVGALYVRRGVRGRLKPLVYGGGQERRLRPGTENVPGIVGFGAACEIAARDLAARAGQERRWRDRLIQGLLEAIPGALLNGPAPGQDGAAAAGGVPGLDGRLSNNVNVSIPDVAVDVLLAQLDLEGVAASSGSACTAGSVRPSHVLRAMGRDLDAATHVLRLTVGRSNDDEQIEQALEIIPRAVARLRRAGRFTVQRG